MTTAAPLQPTFAHQPSPPFTAASTHIHTEGSNKADSLPTENQGHPIHRGPVTAELNFYEPPADGSRPFNYVEQPPAGQPQRNFDVNTVPVRIDDLRGQEHNFSLDGNAFETLTVPPPTVPTDFTSDASIRTNYYPEVESLLLSALPGSHRVVLFDHTVRRARPDAPRAPVTRVHIDQTPASAAARVRLHLPPAEAEALARGRVRLVNVWRPLNGPVASFPLAVADGATVRDEDLVGVEHRYPDRTGETAAVSFEKGQRWYYWSGMTDEERLLLKCYDSDEVVGGVGRVPHTAFVDPRTKEGVLPRESIEVRALVFG